MRAYRLQAWGRAGYEDVPEPKPGPGEVLVRVGGTGLCATDLKYADGGLVSSVYSPPFTLGHEIAGWVEELGAGVGRNVLGEAVALYTMEFCGVCSSCRAGRQNECRNAAGGRGFGKDGGLAQYVLASPQQLIKLGTLDPSLAAPLTDAGMTSFHAVRRALPKLGPGSTAVVIGVGGLGSFAVQFLRELTPATIVAVDVTEDRMLAAASLGAAHTICSSDQTEVRARVRDLTGGFGAEAVLDFVGSTSTLGISMVASARGGTIVVVGAGGGSLPLQRGELPFGCELSYSMGGTLADVEAAVRLAEQGRLTLDVESFGFDQIEDAYAALRDGQVSGRAVVIPD